MKSNADFRFRQIDGSFKMRERSDSKLVMASVAVRQLCFLNFVSQHILFALFGLFFISVVGFAFSERFLFGSHVVTLRDFRHRAVLFLELLDLFFAVLFGLVLAVEVENVVFRLPDELLRIPVAVETPCHEEGFALIRHHLFLDRTVTVVAIDAAIDVNAVIEVDEIRNRVQLIPLERLAFGVAGSNRLKERTIRPNLRVARHASLGGRESCVGGLLNGGVTVSAVDSKLDGVMFVAERNGLLLDLPYFRIVGRP